MGDTCRERKAQKFRSKVRESTRTAFASSKQKRTARSIAYLVSSLSDVVVSIGLGHSVLDS